MKYRRLFSLLAAAMLLTGCAAAPVETTAPSETTIPLVQIPPETTAPPTTAPTEPPEMEPELLLSPGRSVVADGDRLESGSLVYEGVTYVNAVEFLKALDDTEVSGSADEGYGITWRGTEYRFVPGNEGIIRNGTTTVLASPVLTLEGEVWIPVEEICSMWNISLLNDEEFQTLYCTASAGSWSWIEGVKIPILMYHGVTDATWGEPELFVSPSDLDDQIKYLVENGYDTITFEDWENLEDFDKPVMLTFDDGYLDNYEELFPILQKYNAKATIFVITTSVDRDERTMTSEQASEMAHSGLVSIQSHTYNHPHLSECTETELRNQMRWSKYAITRMTGYEPFVICYPYGDSDEQARETAAEHYRFGLNMTGGLYTTSADVFQITRFYVARSTSLSEFIDMVDEAGT